jgi:predicted nucleic acid-binding protein
MLVIADSSALVALAACDALALLLELYGDIYAPQAVYNEVVIPGKPQAAALQKFLQKRIVAVDTTAYPVPDANLGQGEIEAMALYRFLVADLLLIDDRRARITAEAQQMRCIGALGVLLAAKQQGVIAEITPYIDRLRQSSLYYNPALLVKLLQLAHEI